MGMLSEEQKQRVLEVMRKYLSAPTNPDGSGTPIKVQAERDQKRISTINDTLKPLVEEFLQGNLPLDQFKSQIDSLNKHHEYWGFKGIKGQMFFNVLFNRSEDLNELTEEMKSAIVMPSNENMAQELRRGQALYFACHDIECAQIKNHGQLDQI